MEVEAAVLGKGEKLYEELLISREAVLDTPHAKLKIAKNETTSLTTLEVFDELLDQNQQINCELLKKLVPEYKSVSNSK